MEKSVFLNDASETSIKVNWIFFGTRCNVSFREEVLRASLRAPERWRDEALILCTWEAGCNPKWVVTTWIVGRLGTRWLLELFRVFQKGKRSIRSLWMGVLNRKLL